MKRIHFEDFNKMNYWVILIILSLILLVIGTFKPFDFQNPKVYKYLSFSSFLLLSLYLTRMFWHKNHVQSNKKGLITIRVNSFLGKTLMYRNIKNVELSDKKLLVSKNNGATIEFNLVGIEESDIKKLYLMINKGANSNNN